MAFDQFGETTKTLLLKTQSHKLSHAFDVAAGAEVKIGQPVKLNTTGDILPAAAGELSRNIIGYAIQNGKANDTVTIVMKAHVIIFAKPNAALASGPVAYGGTNDEEEAYMSFQAGATDTEDIVGWALDAAGAGDEEIRVALL
ncbi:MAG: hypothetical protein CL596_05340 [Alteromonas sp.]|nr:hypothetical protein [Alteromonas sp.]|tara:strand:+ start:1761 stop:2189 length:429 start_codon:yes stop_codon:yes gene_type:complete